MTELPHLVATAPSLIIGGVAFVLTAALALGAGRQLLTRAFSQSRVFTRAALATFGAIALSQLLVAALHPPLAVVIAVWVTTLLAPMALLLVSLRWRIAAVELGQRSRTVLAVGAHPDDIELAAGGTLARLVDRGHRVHVLVASGGGVGGDATQRPDEAHAAASYLGATSTRVLDFPDTRLATASTDLTTAIEHTIRRVSPDMILTHSAHDQHQDHVAVHQSVLRAARREHSILCFESPSATRAFTPTVFVDVEKYVRIMEAAIAMHANQLGKPYMSKSSVRGVAAFRGRQARLAAAEGFEAVRLQIAHSKGIA